MNTKINKNGTISIYGMPIELFDAINSILIGSEVSLEPFDEGTFCCNGDVRFIITQEQKDLLDKINWIIR